MKETIYTIPIHEAFEKKDGCPLCMLYTDIERSSLEFITGAAMMEPDVRIQTNKKGFCGDHFRDMLKLQNRLSVALMLQSHLDELKKQCFAEPGLFSAGPDSMRAAKATAEAAGSCFVCGRIKEFMSHYIGNLLYMWKTSVEFRRLFSEQQLFCLPHLAAMLEGSTGELTKKEAKEFAASAIAVSRAHLNTLTEDVTTFTKSFDYRNSTAVLTENQKQAIDRSIYFLTSQKKGL